MSSNTAAVLATILVAGCSGGTPSDGGSTGQTPPSDYFSGKIAYDDMTAQLTSKHNTAYVEPFIEGMPSSGGATFEGYFLAVLNTTAQTTRVLGMATVNANFQSGDMWGSASNFVGVDRTGAMDSYSGGISMPVGDHIGVNRPNDFELPYSGSLSGNGEIVSLSGTITGHFKADPVLGILGEDAAPTATIGGSPFTGRVNLSAEIQP